MPPDNDGDIYESHLADIKRKKAKAKAKAHKPLKRRPRPLAPSGRASTHTTSLSPAQDAWVRSRPEGVSAYLRGLVEADRAGVREPERCAVDVVDGTG
jgi:hypothetical protein